MARLVEADRWKNLCLACRWVHDAGIEDVEAATFSNLTSLKQLWIYNNGMKFHPRGAYSSLPHDAELYVFDACST